MADSEWQQALGGVPRELFIPELIWVENQRADGYVAVCRSENPRRWGELVAADDAVVTQVDDGHTAPGSVGRSPSSSGSKPSIVADMLSALDVHPGQAVLEIGTGTGWNAALLSERVGETGRVVSVEIDAELAAAARTALARADYRVSVIIADGVAGYAPGARYDRVLSTAAVRRDVPGAWVAQTRPGGLIVTPWGTSYHNGTQLRLRVGDDNTAAGRFSGNLAFMRLRTQRGPCWVDDEDLDGADSSKTMLSSPEIGEAVASFDGSFAVGLHVPDCRVHVEEDAADGQHVVWLSDGQSLARVVVEVGGSSHQVHQCGPRRLWDEVESAYRWWRDAGQPSHTRFGVTVTPDDQMVWLDDPANTVPNENIR
ncbi:MAG: methyltransferase domain-containing protein [Pseudonocardiaceae bacterium]